MTSQWSDEKEAAVAAVRCAASVCLAVQRQLVTAQTIEKKDRSPVTVADFASQAVVCAKLMESFPDDGVVGEEDSRVLREEDQSGVLASVVDHVATGLGKTSDSGQVLDWIDRGGATGQQQGGGHAARFWTLDPIDGTKGFLRGEQYAVALALIENGQVVLGVLGCPNLSIDGGGGVLLVAVRGQGTWIEPLNGGGTTPKRVHVSAVSDPSGARFCESVESGHSSQSDAQKVAQQLGITAEPVRMDSQAKYATVARGEASIYLRLPTRADYVEKIWDHGAGMIVVSEAGGRVTDVAGKPLDFTHGRTLASNRGVIATNGSIHDVVVAAVQGVLG